MVFLSKNKGIWLTVGIVTEVNTGVKTSPANGLFSTDDPRRSATKQPLHSTKQLKKSSLWSKFAIFLAFLEIIEYNKVVVIPLITSLISNPNTPFNKRDLRVSFVIPFVLYY